MRSTTRVLQEIAKKTGIRWLNEIGGNLDGFHY
jgi:hypothetical protein